MEDVRVGVIGVGHLGRIHARIYKELMGAKLVGVVDTFVKSAKEVGVRYDVPYYTDVDAFLREQAPDALSIAVPTESHFDVAYDMAKRGIHLLVEKPVTTTVQQASKLLEIAKAMNIVLQVGHVERFNSAVRYVSQQIKNDPLYIQVRRQGPFSNRAVDVGVVLDLMIHDIDIVLSLVRSDIEKISSVGRKVFTKHEDFAVAQIAFKSGTIADILASRVSDRMTRQMDIAEIGRYFTINFMAQEVTVFGARESDSEGVIENIKHPILTKTEPLKKELEHFVNCVRSGSHPLVGIYDGKKALEVAVEILRQINLSK